MSEVPPLIWLADPIRGCIACGGDIGLDETVMTVLARPQQVRFRVEMGRCEQCRRWHAALGDLYDMLESEAGDFHRVDGFQLDGVAVEAGVWLNEELGILPWSLYEEEITRMMDQEALPPPSPEEVQQLAQFDEVWEVGYTSAGRIVEDDEEVDAYVAVVASDQGFIRAHGMTTAHPPNADVLAEMILRAALMPHPPSEPGRPSVVRLENEEMAKVLHAQLQDAGINVEAGAVQIDDVLGEAIGALDLSGPPPFFQGEDEQRIHSYFEAAEAFYAARPWTRVEGSKYIAFRLNGGPWKYLNVMGQMEQDPGLSIFDDWLHLCRVIHSQPSLFEMAMGTTLMDSLTEMGSMEGVSLIPIDFLAREDVSLLVEMGIAAPEEEIPLPIRYSSKGLVATSMSLDVYRALLVATRKAVEKRRATPITSIKETFEVDDLSVTLRFPATGRENMPEDPRSVRLQILGGDVDVEGVEPLLPPGYTLQVRAPGDTPLSDIQDAIQDELKLFIESFRQGEARIWARHAGPYAPSPYLFQLSEQEDLWAVLNEIGHPMEVLPSSSAVDNIEVTLRDD